MPGGPPSRTPGSDAPPLALPALWNSMFRTVLKCGGPFSFFLRSALSREEEGSSTSFTWPCPMPFPEAFAKSFAPGLWRKRLLNLSVAYLSFLHLGRPCACPPAVRLGVPLNRKQWQAVQGLKHLVFGSFFPLQFEAADYGRVGHKVEGQSKVLETLGRAAASLCRSFAGYQPPAPLACSFAGASPVAEEVGLLPGKPDVAALPIVADRVKLPARPGFDPRPYMNCTTKNFYEKPLKSARAPEPGVDQPPFVKLLGQRREVLKLLRGLAETGRLQILTDVPADRKGWGAGLFCVAKDAGRDRLVLDGRPANLLESFPGHFVHSLAASSCLGGIVLRPGQTLVMSGTDLEDCFYQFQVSRERAVRNLICGSLTRSEAAFVFDCPAADLPAGGTGILCGLSSLAMGDSSACEFAQCSHLGVLVQGRAVYPGELLLQASSPPRSLLSIGLVIDDLVVLQRCWTEQLEDLRARPGSSLGARRLRSALSAYDAAKLRYSAKKTFEEATQASFWGVDCCGVSGLVRPNPARYWPLVLITARVLQLGLATRALLESLLGSWVSVFMVRRRLLCLADLCFQAVRHGTPQTILRLSPELSSELAGFILLGHFAVLDLRAPVLPLVIATDASSSWQAAVQAALHPAVAEEFLRHSLQRGAWTRLLSPPAAWLREHALLEPEGELPGEEAFQAHPVAEATARVLQYRCLWRREYKRRIHINVAELGAYLREEARLAGRCSGGRFLAGLDSQVCLGALIKGRSASHVLNDMLTASLGPLLSSRLFPGHLFFPSALNPADDPTRHQPVRTPSLEKPRWWEELERGSHEAFEHMLQAVGQQSDSNRGFSQEDLFALGAARPVLLKSNRERGLSSFAARGLRSSRVRSHGVQEPVAESLAALLGKVAFGSAVTEAVDSLPLGGLSDSPLGSSIHPPGSHEKPESHAGSSAYFSDAVAEAFDSLPQVAHIIWSQRGASLHVPGVLLLTRPGVRAVTHFLRHGAPWILHLDNSKGAEFDWGTNAMLQRSLLSLLSAGMFSALAVFPVASSFSRAIRPPVRSAAHPLGLPHISPGNRAKVVGDNRFNTWLAKMVSAARAGNVGFVLDAPDCSFAWRCPGWELERLPSSSAIFRVDLCQFGCTWRKRTRVSTNTSLGGARLLCHHRVKHLPLVGHSRAHRLPWTSVAVTLPAPYLETLALSLCARAGWTCARPLDSSACAKLGSCCRVGEAKNPGPRRPRGRPLQPRCGDLESRPLQSDSSLRLGAWAWDTFLRWVSPSLSVPPLPLFGLCPVLAAMALRAYGNHLFSAGGSKHTFRYTLVGAQRALFALKGSLSPAWELLTRWEAVEPTMHRTPLPEPLLKAMVAVAWLRGLRSFCACALLAFYGMARIGEVLQCERRHLILETDLFHSANAIFLRLDCSKTSARGRPKVQHIRVDDPTAMKLISIAFQELQASDKLFAMSPSAFRARWDKCLLVLGLSGLVDVTPGSLRGGGAVWAYHRGTAVQDIQWKLRLKHMGTLEHYLQEVAALSALNDASPDSKVLIRCGLQLYPFLSSSA